MFRDALVRDYYLDRIRKKRFRAELSDYFRMGFFSLNFPKVKVREEWEILPTEDRDYTMEESKQFWKEWQEILTMVAQ